MTRRFLHQLATRRVFLWLTGVLVCAYAFTVVWYVSTIPDLGIKSIFGATVKGYFEDYVVPAKAGVLPQAGDAIVEVGDQEIKSWPDLLNAPILLQRKLPDAEPSGTSNELPSWARRDSRVPGQILVRVRFERERTETAEPLQFTCWCVLGKLPLEELSPALLWFCLKLLLFVVGVLVLWKRPADPASVQFFVLCVVTLGAYIGGYHWIHITTAPPLLIGFMICAVLLPAVTLHFYLVFPRPKSFVSTQKIWTLLGLYGLPVILLAAILVLYLHLRNLYHNQAAAPEEVEAVLTTLLYTIYATFLVAGLLYLFSIAALIHSYVSTPDVTERNQVKCLLLGAALSLVPIGYSLVLVLFFPNNFGAGGATWPMFLASVCVTAAFVVGITRYRLMELDKIISSGATYFLISFLVGLAYCAVVFLGTVLFSHVLSGPPLADALKVSTVALLLMLVLDLARSRFKRVLDRRFHREKYHLDRTLQRMGEAVEQLVDPPTLVQRLLHASSDLLGVSRGAVYLRQGEPPTYRLAGWTGPAPAHLELPTSSPLPEALGTAVAVRVFPWEAHPATAAQRQLRALEGEVAYALAQEGRVLAFLVLGAKGSGPYRHEDLNLLGAFAQITVLALGSAEGHQTIELLNRDLQTKVEKIAEQQRRIFALQSQLRRRGQRDGDRIEDRGSRIEDGRSKTEVKVVSGGASRSSILAPRSSEPNGAEADALASFCTDIIGSGPEVRRLLHMVSKVSRTDAVVLIRGESGTGKELLAGAIHDNSPRAGQTYVKVHCAALSPTLLESELFGHVKGAFTGAHRDKVGRFELANGGTLFLDEVGDISLEVQTKLLRVLQDQEFERVGSSEPLKVNVRIVAATHQNLEELIRLGRFREDLYYRLNVFPVTVPPLRQRREDITELALHFLNVLGQRCGKGSLHIDDEALAVLKAFDWPGNIRQLENVIERAVVLVEGPVITVADLPVDVRRAVSDGTAEFGSAWPDAATADSYGPDHTGLGAGDESAERERLQRALDAAGGNKAQAARDLGLARSTLVSRLKKYGML